MDSRTPNSLASARANLLSIANREPWWLRLSEPASRPLLYAFVSGLALGGFSPAKRWFIHHLRHFITHM